MQARRRQAGTALSPETLFGIALRDLRKDRGFTQEGLAEETGYHRVFIGYLEQGKRSPSLRTIVGLASVLAVRPSELLQRFEAQILEGDSRKSVEAARQKDSDRRHT